VQYVWHCCGLQCQQIVRLLLECPISHHTSIPPPCAANDSLLSSHSTESLLVLAIWTSTYHCSCCHCSQAVARHQCCLVGQVHINVQLFVTLRQPSRTTMAPRSYRSSRVLPCCSMLFLLLSYTQVRLAQSDEPPKLPPFHTRRRPFATYRINSNTRHVVQLLQSSQLLCLCLVDHKTGCHAFLNWGWSPVARLHVQQPHVQEGSASQHVVPAGAILRTFSQPHIAATRSDREHVWICVHWSGSQDLPSGPRCQPLFIHGRGEGHRRCMC
jgi:hypothetical protein